MKVSATYTGANAETVQKSVIVPLEESINGVENMSYMVSSATNTGSASITIYFRQGTDPDMAMVNVQNRIASAQGLLPAEVTKTGITVRKRQTSNIKSIAIYSPDGSFDEEFLNNYMKINIEPRLSRIPGVGEANVFGSDYSMRIWLDPNKMAKYGLVPPTLPRFLPNRTLNRRPEHWARNRKTRSSMCSNTAAVMKTRRTMKISSSVHSTTEKCCA